MRQHVSAFCAMLCLAFGTFAWTQEVLSTPAFSETVEGIESIPAERWTYLAENPGRMRPSELNFLAPELGQVEVDNSISDATAGETLRVVAWNLERGRHWREAGKLLQEHPALRDADLVLLSEMDYGMGRTRNEHTTRELALALGMNYAFAIEFLELSGGKAEEVAGAPSSTHGYHGNAVLSRFPLRNVRAIRFPGIERWYGSNEHRLGGRVAVFAEVILGDAPITLISTHYESDLGDHASRELQTRLVLAEVNPSSGENPVIFGGDLNTVHTRPAVTLLQDAGFEIGRANLLDEPTIQRVKDGRLVRVGAHIDYLATRGLEIVAGPNSPAVVLAAYPSAPEGKPLGDHAAVSLVVRQP